ncbi:ERF family protein [Neorhizobium sp. SOG26]|uniref:ERF family protein n=1 Tax=Neorhizobium sp. SOG26 TaxID=2060726 RepID=UPI0019029945|nr:ERF family protein [Neorhizobium sp. SOG26]
MAQVIDPAGTEQQIGGLALGVVAKAKQAMEAKMGNAVEIHKPTDVEERRPTALTPMEMVGRALEMGVSADILKQMMDLRDREEARNAKLAFTRAVAAAKAEIRPIMKTREVDYTPQGKQRVNYRHEDLAGIEEQVTPILTKHGLSYRFESDNGVDRPITVTCVLEHVDGHATRTPLSAGADNSGGKNSLQAIASAVTYLQRYTLKLALGLSVSHDDDGKAADEEKEPERISPEQVKVILQLLEETNSDVERFCKLGKIDCVPDMLASQFDSAVRILNDRKAKMGQRAAS